MLARGDTIDFLLPSRLTVLEALYRSEENGRELYKVHRDADGLDYALKVFPLRDVGAADLQREIVALNRQNQSPDRLPRFRGLHVAGGSAHVLLDWIEGVTLDRITGGKPASSRDDVNLRLLFVGDLCRTVALMHRARFVHRDLKPQNVVVRDPRRPAQGVAVIDLGLTAQPRLSVEGTLGYRAPEQDGFRAFNLGPQTDVFAIGQIAWFVLTGAPLILVPREGLAGWAEGTATLKQLLPQLSMPPELEPELLRAMAFRPQDRHANADRLGERLRAVTGTR